MASVDDHSNGGDHHKYTKRILVTGGAGFMYVAHRGAVTLWRHCGATFSTSVLSFLLCCHCLQWLSRGHPPSEALPAVQDRQS